tara:strand:- start:77038 stop:77319 length:282 start_codon:yes stop_codon:yes gene_type:complete
MTHIFLQALLLMSCGLFAISSERHRHSFLLKHHAALLTVKIFAWVMLSIALYFSQLKCGWALGLVYFTGHASFACGFIHFTLIANKRIKSNKS